MLFTWENVECGDSTDISSAINPKPQYSPQSPFLTAEKKKEITCFVPPNNLVFGHRTFCQMFSSFIIRFFGKCYQCSIIIICGIVDIIEIHFKDLWCLPPNWKSCDNNGEGCFPVQSISLQCRLNFLLPSEIWSQLFCSSKIFTHERMHRLLSTTTSTLTL